MTTFNDEYSSSPTDEWFGCNFLVNNVQSTYATPNLKPSNKNLENIFPNTHSSKFQSINNNIKISDILWNLTLDIINEKIRLEKSLLDDDSMKNFYSRKSLLNNQSDIFNVLLNLDEKQLEGLKTKLHTQLKSIVNTLNFPLPNTCNPVDLEHEKLFHKLLQFYDMYSGTVTSVCDNFDVSLLKILVLQNFSTIMADAQALLVKLPPFQIYTKFCKYSGLTDEEINQVVEESTKESKKLESILPSETGLGFLARDSGGAMEEELGIIRFICITNNRIPDNMMKLVTLKNIFSRQLPKMPREYIVRLVFDRNHYSFCLLKNKKLIGGVCFRPFFSQRFAEIVFLAITSSEQVKGYGTRLMSHLKEHVKRIGILYFLTYADNFAIGYFRKQGFTQKISQPTSKWLGYIKDYDGGTLMECYIHPDINYLKLPEILREQKLRIKQEIEKRKPLVTYPGINVWNQNPNWKPHPSEIPGFIEAGWKEELINEDKKELKPLSDQILVVLEILSKHENSWPFRKPVTTTEAADYYNVIRKPIDLSTMKKKAKNNQYRTKKQFGDDLILMFNNCRLYNHISTIYYKYANELQRYIWPKYEGIQSND